MSTPALSTAAETIIFELCEEIISTYGATPKPVSLSTVRKFAYEIWLQGRVDMGREMLETLKSIPAPAKFRQPTFTEMDLARSVNHEC